MITFSPQFIKIHQKLIWVIIRGILRIFKNYHVSGTENLKGLTGPLIIASNHKSMYDGYFIGASIPFRSKLFPLYFMTDYRYIERPFLGLYLRSIGDFPVYEKAGLDQSLETSAGLLEKGFSVCIMPEGKLYREDGIAEGKIGAAALALRTGMPILPMAIYGGHAFNERTFFTRRHPLYISFGTPFKLEGEINPAHHDFVRYRQGTEIIMGKVKILYEAIIHDLSENNHF